jgi:predicted MFS family arabinose efflux permease
MLPMGLAPEMGAAVAVALAVATSRFGRKPLLLATLACYSFGNALMAAAPLFGVVALGRTLGGITYAWASEMPSHRIAQCEPCVLLG